MPDSRRWTALVSVALATFMTYLDNNVVNVALPSIQRDLRLTLSGLEWIVSAYILVFAGLLLIGGRLADVFRIRRTFLLGVWIFTFASLIAGLADGQHILISARAVQGVGAALLTPAALALIPAVFPDPRERSMAIGVWGGIGALALAAGPFTGGYLSEHLDWGWIFLINVPIGLLATVLAMSSIHVDAGVTGAKAAPSGTGTSATRATITRRLDLPGLVTSSIALFALTFALIEGDSRGWTSAVILGSFGIAAVFTLAFVYVQARTAVDPMIDLSLFGERVFSGGLLATGLWAFGVFGIYFFTALYLQNALGFTPTEAGAAFIPMALLTAIVAILSTKIVARLGTAVTVATGLVLMALAIGMLSTVGAGSDYLDLLPPFLLYGVGAGLILPLTDVLLNTIPSSHAGIASGVLNVSREIFGLLGITVLGAILSSRRSAYLHDGRTPLTAFLDAYRLTLIIAAAIVAIGVPLSLYALRGVRSTAAPDRITPALKSTAVTADQAST